MAAKAPAVATPPSTAETFESCSSCLAASSSAGSIASEYCDSASSSSDTVLETTLTVGAVLLSTELSGSGKEPGIVKDSESSAGGLDSPLITESEILEAGGASFLSTIS